jgi:phosphatidyl-myo-inositol dimannoside synthase
LSERSGRPERDGARLDRKPASGLSWAPLNLLVLTTDAFGGYGGIAKYNRDFITALAAHPDVAQVTVLPRVIPGPLEATPPKVSFVTESARGKLAFVRSATTASLRGPYDWIVCGHVNLLPVARVASALLGAPIVLLIYGIDVWTPTRSRLVNLMIPRVAAWVSISDCTTNRLRSWSPEPVRAFLCPNAIELSEYAVGPKSEALLDRYGLRDRTVLLTLGRLDSRERYKGIDEVMTLLPELSRSIPTLSYVVAGDGDDRHRLEQKARALGVAERVVFTGRVPEAEKADVYRLADAYVMPGRGEGFGFVFLEAMACGIPVVASKVDGSREAARDGKLGVIVDPDDPREVRDGILEALRRPRDVVPEGLDYFSYANFEKRTHAILDELTGAPQASQ